MKEDRKGDPFRLAYGKGEGEARERAASLLAELSARFGSEAVPGLPPLLASAPGRTELGGNHTDHNRGRVLAAAVRLDAMAAALPAPDGKAVVLSRGWGEPISVDLTGDLEPDPAERGTTAALLRGVARALRDKGWALGGFRAVMDSAVPSGSGLSSSACVEVLFGKLLSELFNGGRIGWVELALAGKRAENDYFGKPCGLMDQMACSGGGILAMDFRDPAAPGWKRAAKSLKGTGCELAIVRTGGSHADLTADYASIPEEMRAAAAVLGRETLRGATEEDLLRFLPELRRKAGDRAIQRALHFIAEDKRAAKMAEALEAGAFRRFLKLSRSSGRSSWTLLQNVAAPGDGREQGPALALALSAAFLGGRGSCRIHGGGFAGTIQAFVPPDRAEAYVELMERAFGPGCVLFPGIRPVGAIRLE